MCSKILIPWFFAVAIAVTGGGGAATAAEIRARGSVDIPSATHFDEDIEPAILNDPFERSKVSVARSGAEFTYSASANIGLLELKAFGQLVNTGGALSDIEVEVLTASARLRDTLTFESETAEDYELVFELDVDGVLDFDGGNAVAQASLSTGAFSGQNDFLQITTSGPVNETLSVTRTFDGTVENDITISLFVRIFEIDAGATVTGELSNTATLRVILPQGVTIAASESGTFNAVIDERVPLPGALPLFCSALGGFFGWGRRRQQAVA